MSVTDLNKQKISKDELKASLSLEQVLDYVNDFFGEGKKINPTTLIFKTVCHNHAGEGSHKLYYYDNTHLFKCYTECSDVGSFDIYELTLKVKKIQNNEEWSLPKAIYFVAKYFGYSTNDSLLNEEEVNSLKDWDYFKEIEAKENSENQINIKVYDDKILNNLPFVRILSWEKENIDKKSLKLFNIKYNPMNHSVIIPHYDIDNHLVGIRERTLLKVNEEYGKYKPAILGGFMYNHPLGLHLYGLNQNKDNISQWKQAIVFESEKSVLKYNNYFGKENNIAVACCGSSLSNYQANLLLALGVKEIVIAFDKQFKEKNDDEFKRWTKKLKSINDKYSHKALMSFMFDKNNDILGYKDSPIDNGIDNFMKLYERRIFL